MFTTDKSHTDVVSVVFKDNITSIDDHAFYQCTGLTSIDIPASITSIGDWAFFSSGLTSFTGGNSVTSIGNYAFMWSQLADSLTIPASVTTIGEFAFQDCTGLTSVTFDPGSELASIGKSVFNGCTGLTSITIPEYVTSIEDDTFDGCARLTSVTFEPGSQLTSIGDRAFYGCNSLTSLDIRSSLTSIGSNAFRECSGLTSITLGSFLTSIGINAFYKCSGLTSITIPASVTSIGDWAFGYSGITSVTFEPGSQLTSISDHAFYNCNSLTSITIPESVTSIGEYGIANCDTLSSVTIPASVITIKDRGIYQNHELTSITFEADSQLTTIGYMGFYGSRKLPSITIPESVTSIGEYAFYECPELTNITIPSGISTDNLTESHTSISYYNYFDETINTASDANGVIYQNNAFASGKSYVDIVSVEFKDNITDIGANAFTGCTGLTSVTIPFSVTTIGNAAFAGCTGLTSITIGNSVTSIGDDAFSGLQEATFILIKVDNLLEETYISADEFPNRIVLSTDRVPVYSSVYNDEYESSLITEFVSTISNVNVINTDNSNKYVLNDHSSYSSTTRYGLNIGTYTFSNISSDHPLAIVTNDYSNITYSGDESMKQTKTLNLTGADVTYKFFYGDVTVTVTGDFGNASLYCYNHGYMGGENLLVYSDVSLSLAGKSLRRTDLTDAVLTGADLAGAVLTDANLAGADLTDAVLTDAVLTNADLAGAYLTGAVLTGVKSGGIVGDPALPAGFALIMGYLVGPGANLTNAVLTDAVLTNAVLTDADLTGAVLTNAVLTGALYNYNTIGLTTANKLEMKLVFPRNLLVSNDILVTNELKQTIEYNDKIILGNANSVLTNFAGFNNCMLIGLNIQQSDMSKLTNCSMINCTRVSDIVLTPGGDDNTLGSNVNNFILTLGNVPTISTAVLAILDSSGKQVYITDSEFANGKTYTFTLDVNKSYKSVVREISKPVSNNRAVVIGGTPVELLNVKVLNSSAGDPGVVEDEAQTFTVASTNQDDGDAPSATLVCNLTDKWGYGWGGGILRITDQHGTPIGEDMTFLDDATSKPAIYMIANVQPGAYTATVIGGSYHWQMSYIIQQTVNHKFNHVDIDLGASMTFTAPENGTFTTMIESDDKSILNITSSDGSSALMTTGGGAHSIDLIENVQYTATVGQFLNVNISDTQPIPTYISIPAGTMNTDPQEFVVDTDNTTVYFDLEDSYGDGWNGGVLKITDQEGTVRKSDMTIITGKNTQYTLTLDSGTYTATVSGESWIDERSYTIYPYGMTKIQAQVPTEPHVPLVILPDDTTIIGGIPTPFLIDEHNTYTVNVSTVDATTALNIRDSDGYHVQNELAAGSHAVALEAGEYTAELTSIDPYAVMSYDIKNTSTTPETTIHTVSVGDVRRDFPSISFSV